MNEVSDNRGRSLSNESWSQVLIEALPYFKQWCGKTIVIKYGGNAMLNDVLKSAVVEDIVLLHTIGVHVVLVHGGGPEINKMLNRTGIESHFINGLRVTDKATMEIVLMVLTGKLNKDIVSLLLSAGGNAVGVSGIDSGLLVAKKLVVDASNKVDPSNKDSAAAGGGDVAAVDLGFVGEVTQVNPKILVDLLDRGFIPVVSTVAIGAPNSLTAGGVFDTNNNNNTSNNSSGEIPFIANQGANSFNDGAIASGLQNNAVELDKKVADFGTPTAESPNVFYNINADTAAAKIACALKAEKFVQLTNVSGVLTDVNDSSTLIARIPASNVPHLIEQGTISGGMIPKVECCMTALRGGVRRTHIIDGRVPHSLLIEMFSDRGIGTMIY